MTTTSSVDTYESTGTADRLLRYLPAITLTAVLTITASAEYQLARQVLGLPPHIAWALPVGVDSYVYAAMRSRRDVGAAVAVMAGSLAAYTTAHLASLHSGGPLPAFVVAPSAAVIMTVLVVVAWRVHVLIHRLHPTAPATATTPHPDTDALPSPNAHVAGLHSALPTASSAPVPSTPIAVSGTASGQRSDPVDVGLPAQDRAIVTLVLAQLAASSDPKGTIPSARALIRDHQLGQKRANRIRQALIDDQQQAQHHDESQNEAISAAIPSSPDPTSQTATKGSTQEAPRNRYDYPHTFITDRVGPANPPGGSAAEHSGNEKDHISQGCGE
jgi:hypothetical protein